MFSYTVYVGPFVRCTYHHVEAIDKHYGCVNEKCLQRGNAQMGAFCPDCGKPVEVISKKSQVASVSHWMVLAEAGLAEDAMMECHGEGSNDKSMTHWFIPNHSRGEPRDFENSRGSELGLLAIISEYDIPHEIQWLAHAFAPELAALEKAYDKIEVTWGIIHYAI